jgi:putative transposase
MIIEKYFFRIAFSANLFRSVITFATKDRMPLIKKHLQNNIHNCIWKKCKKMGLYLHKIGGIEDHIHMLLYIPPKLSGASVIGQIKGASSYYVNNEIGKQERLYWQRGYGMKTVSESDLSKAKKMPPFLKRPL